MIYFFWNIQKIENNKLCSFNERTNELLINVGLVLKNNKSFKTKCFLNSTKSHFEAFKATIIMNELDQNVRRKTWVQDFVKTVVRVWLHTQTNE